MNTESAIYMREGVENKERHFGAAIRYFPVWVQSSGEWMPALFTQAQINEACIRGMKNPEDIPKRKRSLFERIFWR